MVQACAVFGKIYDTEELELRIDKLEQMIKEGVLIPGEKHK